MPCYTIRTMSVDLGSLNFGELRTAVRASDVRVISETSDRMILQVGFARMTVERGQCWKGSTPTRFAKIWTFEGACCAPFRRSTKD